MKNNNGFTLVELLAIILILGIISLIATPTVLEIIDNSKLNSERQNGAEIASSAELFCSDAKMMNESYYSNLLEYADTDTDLQKLINARGEMPDYSDFIQFELTSNCKVKMIYKTEDFYCTNQVNSSNEPVYEVNDDNKTAKEFYCKFIEED